MRRALIVVMVLAMPVQAQEDPLARARSIATAGDRAQALRVLEVHLLQHPRDDDARTLYGIILSWDGQFERARAELRAVLANNPGNGDAFEALTRVERALTQPQATVNQLTAGFNFDDYERSDSWNEGYVELKFAMRRAAILGRVSHAERFDLSDDQIEVEGYPRFGRSSYAFLSIGFAPDATLYPETKFGAELYHAFGRGYEASIGARRLDFEEVGAVNVYTASLSKYVGNWLIGGRVYDSEEDTALQVMARRYYGDHGAYFGFRVGQGSTRDDVRSAADLQSRDVREVAAEGMFVFRQRWVVNVRGGIADDRSSLAGAFGWRF